METPSTSPATEPVGKDSLDIDTIYRSIDPKWQRDFKAFVDTGNARPEFLSYLDSNRDCQEAVEIIFEHEISQIKKTLSKTIDKTSLARQFATATMKLAKSSDSDTRKTIDAAASSLVKNKKERKKLVSVFDEFVVKARKVVSGK